MKAASFEIRAGTNAATHVRTNGLAPNDISCIPAAAGGPKGLALLPLDKLLFGHWLNVDLRTQPLHLIGASIGAWRMAAAAQNRPVEALQRLADYYTAQRYGERPTPRQVSSVFQALVRVILLGPRLEPQRNITVSVITSRARGPLYRDRSRRGFAHAAFDNARDRVHLARHLERVVFHAGDPQWLRPAYDAFGLEMVPLDPSNVVDALQASGSVPLLSDPVVDPSGAPRGEYWDGGLIDYHLLLPYSRMRGIVLFPHFVPYLTPGWLDKHLPWRKRARHHPWLDNVLLICPSRQFLARLPNGRLPDRRDFKRYGLDDAARMRAWRRALSESERFADEAMAWLQRPDPARILAL